MKCRAQFNKKAINPLSEKLSENRVGYSGFSPFLHVNSRKYSLSKFL